MKSKITLIVSNYTWFGMREWFNVTPAVPIITAILKEEFDFSVIDANGEGLSIEETKERIRESKSEIILITALSMEYYRQYHLVAQLSKEVLNNCKVVMGGVYPTVSGENAMKDENLDYIMLGHAEERLDKFIYMILENRTKEIEKFDGIGYRKDGRIIINPVKSYISDVNKMIKPDYSKTNIDNYFNEKDVTAANFLLYSKERNFNIITSYGCPYNCIFCATRTISGRKVAYRDVEDVLEEIEYLIKNYQVTMITFIDDCLLADRKRAEHLLNEMINRNYNLEFRIATVAAWHLDEDLLILMKKAGCSRFGISVESGCDRVLHKIVRKPLKKEIIPPLVRICREQEIFMTANFVIGFPGETWDEIRESLAFAEFCDFDLINIHIATVLPETDLYKIAKEQELLPKNFSFYNENTNFGFCKGNINTEEFTPEELAVLRAYEWDRINFATPEKRKRACAIMGISEEQLDKHRKKTRLNYGMTV